MLGQHHLEKTLSAIDGKGYKAYKEIAGQYDFEDFLLFVDYVQGDPFAAPSRVRIRVSQKQARFQEKLFATRVRRVALEDYLARVVSKNLRLYTKGNRGTGKSGLIAIDACGQEILERSSVRINSDYVEVRLSMGLPAMGRRVMAKQAKEMLLDELPQVIIKGLFAANIDLKSAEEHVLLAEDQDFIRDQLSSMGLIAFVGNGSVLARRSGISDLPMEEGRAVPFLSPPSMETSFNTPNNGVIKGLGIPKGVTLIVGGGYHGKSTLLRAVERGVYNHIPGDGREWVLTDSTAVKIRAEDGRRVERVDISPFINNLPYGKSTESFSTEEASGSTSQAANIIEALETGTKVLLLDEDTSATNFMIRDVRMQRLVAKEKEPITPFIDKVRLLYEQHEVSTMIVIGGAGDYFDVADKVIMMDAYVPKDATQEAKEIALSFKNLRTKEGGDVFSDELKNRIPLKQSVDPTKGKKAKVDAKGLKNIQFGRTIIDLSAVEQLVDVSQTRAVGEILAYMKRRRYLDDAATIMQLLKKVNRDIDINGLDIISPFYGQHPGDYARPRNYEIAAALNRLRTLKVRVK